MISPFFRPQAAAVNAILVRQGIELDIESETQLFLGSNGGADVDEHNWS